MKSLLCITIFVLCSLANAYQPPQQDEEVFLQIAFDVATCTRKGAQYSCEDHGEFKDLNLTLVEGTGDAVATFEKSIGEYTHAASVRVTKASDNHSPNYEFAVMDAFGKQSALRASVNIYVETPRALDVVLLFNQVVEISETQFQIPYTAIAPARMGRNKVHARVMNAVRALLP